MSTMGAYYKLVSLQAQQPNAGFMLGQRLRRWPNMKPALGERLVFCRDSINAVGMCQHVIAHAYFSHCNVWLIMRVGVSTRAMPVIRWMKRVYLPSVTIQ